MTDPKCTELVEYFLQDEPVAVKNDRTFVESLAQDMQAMLIDSIDLRKQEIAKESKNQDIA